MISIKAIFASSILLMDLCTAQESQNDLRRLSLTGKREAQPDFLRYDDEKFPIARNLRGRLSDYDSDVEGTDSSNGIWFLNP